MTNEFWATEYTKLAFVGEPRGYGQSALLGGLSGGALGAGAGALLGHNPNPELSHMGRGAGIGALAGGALGAGVGLLGAHDEHKITGQAQAFHSLPPEEQNRLRHAFDAAMAGVPLDGATESALTPHSDYLYKLHTAHL
jgi:hypothetical protein